MEIFQHPIQICHQIILRLHSSSHTREKVSINLTMKKSLSRQRRRASTSAGNLFKINFRASTERVQALPINLRYIYKSIFH